MDQTLKEGLEYFEAGLSKAIETRNRMEEQLKNPDLSPELRERVQALFAKAEKLIVETADVIKRLESKASR